jgi:ABC-type spermidine/putrescine transport system permease subunit I
VKQELLSKFLGGAVIGLFALAMDYFLLQHFFRTPINMSGGITVVVVLVYLVVPFVILQFAGKRERAEGEK